MIVRVVRSCASAVRSRGIWLMTATMAALPLFLASAPPVQADNSPALRLLKTIPINGTAASRKTAMFSFDISFLDPVTGLYYLGDRSNADLDVVDTTGNFTGTADTLFGQIGGSAFGFAGDTGKTATSGPNGVVAANPCIFATDGPSRVVSINSNVSFVQPVSSVNTGGQFRADELAFDPKDRLLLVINNADNPPFGTVINVSATCQLTIATKTIFDASHGLNATNGAEQPAWDPLTQRFYVSIPEINGPGDGTGPNGGVARLTTAGVIETVYPINFCQPAGLTVGPNGDLLVGCNSVFDFSGKKCSAVVPAPGPGAAPVTCTGAIAGPMTVVCNPSKGCTGNALVAVQGVGGGDEIWFNSGDDNYYVTAGNDPVGPVLGVIKSGVNTLSQLVPTLPPVPAVTTGTGQQHGSGTVHSVAASAANNHVYVPLPANNAYPNCSPGCIGVFGAQ